MTKDISTQSICASGALALLFFGVDAGIIKLVGHWHSDKILRYLHVQVDPLMRNYANIKVHSGRYCLRHNHESPDLVLCY